jgi:hypothetical protein
VDDRSLQQADLASELENDSIDIHMNKYFKSRVNRNTLNRANMADQLSAIANQRENRRSENNKNLDLLSLRQVEFDVLS